MIRKFIIAIAALALLPTAAMAQEGGDTQQAPAPQPLAGKKLVVYITSDDTRQAGLGMFTARMAARAGANVTVILGADSLTFARKDGRQEKFVAIDETPRDILKSVVGFGGRVLICKICVPVLGLEEGDFIDDVQVVTMRDIFGSLFEDGVKTLSF